MYGAVAGVKPNVGVIFQNTYFGGTKTDGPSIGDGFTVRRLCDTLKRRVRGTGGEMVATRGARRP